MQKQFTFHSFALLTSGVIHNIWQGNNSSLLCHPHACNSTQSEKKELFSPAMGRVLGFVHSQDPVFCLRIQCKLSSQKDSELIFYFMLLFHHLQPEYYLSNKGSSTPEWTKKYFSIFQSSCKSYDYHKKNISHLLISTLSTGQNREHEDTGNFEKQHWALTWYLWCPGGQSSPPFCQVHWSTEIFHRWAHHSLSQPDLLLSCTREGLASSQTCRTSHCD